MQPTAPARAVNILFIEDQADVAALIRRRLSAHAGAGMVMTHVGDLRAGLAALKSTPFDVVMTDLNLPDSRGVETVHRLLKICRYIPVVVLSAVDEDQAILDTVESGAQEYIVKGQTDGHIIARTIRQAIKRKQAELKLRRLAHYDSLTGLANRSQFRRRLEQALERGARRRGNVALMMIDLDRFKAVNDTLGHQAGDRMLVMVAKRLRSCLRECDKVARLGGDEFTVTLEEPRSPDEAAAIAQKIVEAISRPFMVGGQEFYVTPSIGITLYPLDGDSADTLIKNADTAMYRVKAGGRNGFKFFTPAMNELTGERLRMQAALRQAIDRNELVLHYQPKVDLQSGELHGVEALLRWQRPGGRLLSPAQFIPLAEDTGLIIPIGEWVLTQALGQVRSWSGLGLPGTRVSVNISPRQFRQCDLAAIIAAALSQTGLSGEHLEIEITEGVLMEDTGASVATLERLKALGVGIAIDDFGTGYSSLHYLKRFPIDTLKIDHSFVSDIPRDHDDATITQAIIGLARNLRLNVIAEGVETREQLAFLRANHCDQGQGYLFSAPLDTAQMIGYLQRERIRADLEQTTPRPLAGNR
ncbi:MAG: EAL domain-containing protein [Gammaproteobacteria bacterium]|nr:EAL domain-containing protein [Gammaproteobacteria bacterium]MCG3145603.1 Chemotaxis response regulator protein-glutamate methylesterase [Gammaproteobacteria bacterium]